MVALNGFRLLVEPPSTSSWLLGGLIMVAGLVLPAGMLLWRKKAFFFGSGSLEVNKLV